MSVLKEIVGKTVTSIVIHKKSVMLETSCGKQYKMYHDCEFIQYAGVDFDYECLTDLIGDPIRSVMKTNERCDDEDYDYESGVYAIYTFKTSKSCIAIRWHSTQEYGGGHPTELTHEVHFKEVLKD